MKHIYGLTSHYLPLIGKVNLSQLDERAVKTGYVFHTQKITLELIEKTFAESKNLMLAFDTKEEAAMAMKVGLQSSNNFDGLIEGKIPFFAVPLIFTIAVEDNFELGEAKLITGEMLFHYFETTSIPYFKPPAIDQGFWKDGFIMMLNEKITKLEFCPKAYHINKDKLPHWVQASYLAANPVRQADVNFEQAEENLDEINAEEGISYSSFCNLF